MTIFVFTLSLTLFFDLTLLGASTTLMMICPLILYRRDLFLWGCAGLLYSHFLAGQPLALSLYDDGLYLFFYYLSFQASGKMLIDMIIGSGLYCLAQLPKLWYGFHHLAPLADLGTLLFSIVFLCLNNEREFYLLSRSD